MKMPLCECGERLEVFTGFTGADYDCEAGEGSGYGWEGEYESFSVKTE